MKEQIYPPKRPNMAHFDPPKKAKRAADPRSELTTASMEKLQRDAKRKRVDLGEP
jgi:hypothetical protein